MRLGLADAGSRVSVDVARGGDDALRRTATERLAEAARTVADVPVALDLETTVAVGLHGDAGLVDGVARTIVGQVVTRHGPEDIVLAALAAPPALRAFEWLRWLPHVRSSASPLPGEHLAVWPDAVTDLLGALLELAAERAGERPHGFPRVVVLVHEEAPVDRAALGRLLDLAPGAGIRVLWVGRDEALLPRHSSASPPATARRSCRRPTPPRSPSPSPPNRPTVPCSTGWPATSPRSATPRAWPGSARSPGWSA